MRLSLMPENKRAFLGAIGSKSTAATAAASSALYASLLLKLLFGQLQVGGSIGSIASTAAAYTMLLVVFGLDLLLPLRENASSA